ncbi:hypothetical protein LVJ94_34735 [Pendulispora rubella]|uniref:Uncharacterized protein n=1 Tax=Pendulispora rubella TaxID=2741070 RepID=A0ABZ2KU64_9BACT
MEYWRKNEPAKGYPGAVGGFATRIGFLAEQMGLTHSVEIREARTANGRLAWLFEVLVVAPDEHEEKRLKQRR